MKNDKNKLNLQILADKPVMAGDQAGQRILEIRVTAPEINTDKKRPPLNLSLVLDRSGSMQGEKIRFARQAAAHVIDLLEETDRASVVIYDDSIETLFPSMLMTPQMKQEAKARILSVHSRGSTNLGGGWLKGCEEAARGAADGSLNRTLLLTDGLANVGITSSEELSMHAAKLNRRGVSTSTFGVGLGYDEHLLEAMANSGGGNFHFLEALNGIPHVFEQEFNEIKNIALRDATVFIQLPAVIKATVSGGWNYEREGDKLKIYIGSLLSGHDQAVYITLEHDAGLAGSELNVPVSVSAKGEDGVLLDEQATFTFNIVPGAQEAAAEQDKPFMERFALVDLADKANEALKKERAGDRNGAARVVGDTMNIYRDHISQGTSDKYQHIADQMSMGMDEANRKRMHAQEYSIKQGRFQVLDYPLTLVNGYPIADIEGKAVLIDSGSPVTIGDEAQWFFLNEVRSLTPEFGGVNAAYLTREIGTRVDILLGTDILKDHFVTINLLDGVIHFSQGALLRNGIRVPFKSLMGTPMCLATIAGVEQQMIIDTGAKLTYVNKALTAGTAPTGTEQDFYVSLGSFETPVFELPVKIGGQNLTFRCGILPPFLDQGIQLTGASGIIGTELYKHFVVSLAYPEGEMVLKPHGQAARKESRETNLEF